MYISAYFGLESERGLNFRDFFVEFDPALIKQGARDYSASHIKFGLLMKRIIAQINRFCLGVRGEKNG